MTTAEMLASLEAQIRKDIPRLMELRVGCILQNEWSKDFFLVYDETENHIRIFQLNSDVPNEQVVNKKHISTYTPFEIIGHDIMLNDVLEWLGKVLKEATEYRIGYTNIGKFGVKYREMLGVMDLSKPLLKDQSEYFIKFLYEFKNEHFRI